MNLPCSVVQDLLPLYAEGLASEDSRALVEAHLAECGGCRKTLADLQTPPAPSPLDVMPMQTVKKMLRRQLWLAVALTLCLVIAAASVFIGWLCRGTPLPYSGDLVTIVKNADGSLDAVFSQPVSWVRCENRYRPEAGLYCAVITCEGASPLSRRMGPGLSQVLHLTQPGERCDLVFYENNAVDGEHILLWGQKPAGWGGWYTLSRLTLNYYVLLAALSAAGLGLLWLLLRKKQAGRVFMYLSVLFLCWLAGHFLIVGGSRVDYYAVPFCFSLICCTAAALFGAFCSTLALVRLRRQA